MATDNFNGSTDGEQLTTYNSDWLLNSGDFDIQNTGSDGGCCPDTGGYHIARYTGTYDDDQSSQGVIDAHDSSNTSIGVSVRADTGGAQTAYTYFCYGSNHRLQKRVAASSTTLAENTTLFSVTDTIYLEADSDQILAKKNGSDQFGGAQTDSAITSGSPGLMGFGNTASKRIDDWEGADLAVGGVIYERTLASSIDVSDPQTRVLDAQRALVSSINVQDIITQEALLIRIVTSNIDVSDSITRVVASIVSRVLSSSVSINDSINTILHLTRGLTDSVVITDSIIRTLELNNLLERVLSSNININDSIATQKWMERQLLDNLDISDSIARTITGAATIISRILSDSVTVEDAIASTKDFTRQLASSITLIDTLASNKELCRLLQDNIDIIDSLTKETALLLERTLSSTVTITDIISRDITLLVTGIIIAKLAIEPIEVGLINETGNLEENWLKYSEELDNVAWGLNPLLTITPNIIIAPNGQLAADKIEHTGGGGVVFYQEVITVADQTSYTFSIYMKEGNKLDDAILIRNTTTAKNLATVRLVWASNTLSAITGTEAVNASAEIENPEGDDGWYRCRITVTTGINIGDELLCYFAFTGQVTVGEYAYGWGAQLAGGEEFIPYYKTTDVVFIEPSTLSGTTIPGLEKLDIEVGLERYTT